MALGDPCICYCDCGTDSEGNAMGGSYVSIVNPRDPSSCLCGTKNCKDSECPCPCNSIANVQNVNPMRRFSGRRRRR